MLLRVTTFSIERTSLPNDFFSTLRTMRPLSTSCATVKHNCSICKGHLESSKIRSAADSTERMLRKDILKVDFFARSKLYFWNVVQEKSAKRSVKITLYVWNKKKKTVKEVKIYIFLICAAKSQDVAQSHKIFARSHDRDIVTFRNSGWVGNWRLP